jgi:5-methyltetrahydropteroyltriglutamate--homocysteine methyltransferase
MGAQRELKQSLEAYWSGKADAAELEQTVRQVRAAAWVRQRDAGLDHVPTGDHVLYDHVLDAAAMVGAVPDRYRLETGTIDPDACFAMARGGEVAGQPVSALEMTKWFDTNYHYLVPELVPGQRFALSTTTQVDQLREAAALGVAGRPVLVGPITFLLLSKVRGDAISPLALLEALLPAYEAQLAALERAGATWVQLDEPVLGTDLEAEALAAFEPTYARLAAAAPSLRLLVATYFTGLRANLPTALRLPVAALHLDGVAEPDQLAPAISEAPESLALSLGLVDGRNVWRTDLDAALHRLEHAHSQLGGARLLVGPSCSLLHLPHDLEDEPDLDPEVRPWLAFAAQRLDEIVLLKRAIVEGPAAVADELEAARAACAGRRTSSRVHDVEVQDRLDAAGPELERRSRPYGERRSAQVEQLGLPLLPTTTIGSFPQTSVVRGVRSRHRKGEVDATKYRLAMETYIKDAVGFQERAGLDVLVHGEPERTDMVEHFGALLDGCLVTRNAWVQSYGSRCVKPPIVFGDVNRPEPMTVAWATYAQSLTERPVKGMLTGPVTILQWSFVRDDQPVEQTCRQLALAVRDEVVDLERAGIGIIQVDEPALREGLPLHEEDRKAFLDWAVACFRITTSGVQDETQIHTHMCYGEFEDVIESIAAFDADVISVEASRSQMQLLEAFTDFEYPNEIGPGVWDIHSPRVPSQEEMVQLLEAALEVLPADRLWVNPDCGLKTRTWAEVEPSVRNLVAAAAEVRAARERG